MIQSQRNETDLELGTVGSETSKVVHFALVNENPVSVRLFEWDTGLHSAAVNLVAIQSGNVSTFLTKSCFNDSVTEVYIIFAYSANLLHNLKYNCKSNTLLIY